MRVEWSQSAVDEKIADWIEQDRGMETANRVCRHIYDLVQDLRAMPYRGRPGRVKDTCEFVIPRLPYLIVYQLLMNAW